MTFERSTWRANRIMKMLPDYQRYTCPARKKVRQERLKDPAVCSDPIPAMMSYWGHDTE